MDTTRVDFDCPHCGMGHCMEAGEALYTNEVEDECASRCEACGEWYQLRCVSVDIEMETMKAKKQQADQSDD